MQDDSEPEKPAEPVETTQTVPPAPDKPAEVPEPDPKTETEPEPESEPEPEIPITGDIVTSNHRPRKKIWWLVALLIILLLAGAGSIGWQVSRNKTPAPAAAVQQTAKPKAITKTQGLTLDTSKDYGNKYKDGIVPVGDGKYVTTGPKTGYVYACANYAKNLVADSGGAMTRGPWFTDNNTEYNVNQKLHVQGSVMWSAQFTNTLSGNTRTIVTNDLPSHPTGIFPIMASDPAYTYDRNPNTIKGQTFTYALNADPTYSTTPSCMGGQVGIMLTGVALFSAFDAGGRDAGAWEVQDSCDGHPQSDGIYHYHTLSSCIKDASVNTVIGYALDGFPITGPQVAPGNILTTADLDECHGITSQINLDGKSTTMYHYVMTEDFPYSVSCYRGTAIQPPGMQVGQQSTPAHP